MTGRVVLALLILLSSLAVWAYTRHDNRDIVHVRAVSTSGQQPATTTTTEPAPRATALHTTAYCLKSRMSNGQHGYLGAVAMNGVPLGTRVVVDDSPIGPGTFTVTDRHAPGSTQLDFYVTDCWLAERWGRVTVHASFPGHRVDEYRP